MPDSVTPDPTMNRGAGHDQPPALPGVPPLAALLQGRFIAAAHYASLLLQMLPQLFPGTPWLALSDDQRRVLFDETDHLLLRARWRVESRGFADKFSIAQAGIDMAPRDTVLGERPPEVPMQAPPTGQYL